jgi:hypothetical protein
MLFLLQAFLHPEGADHMRDIVVTETLEDIDKVPTCLDDIMFSLLLTAVELDRIPV